MISKNKMKERKERKAKRRGGGVEEKERRLEGEKRSGRRRMSHGRVK